MYIAAYAALLIGLIAALAAGGVALLQLKDGEDRLINLAIKAHWLVFACLTFASAALLHALYWHDYRLDYVASYTDSLLPVFYRLTAFWAGQPGSLLFWALITALCGIIWQFSRLYATLPARIKLWFWVFFSGIMAFFCLLLTAWSNPFLILEPAPADGQGLNPLLQNPGMIIHPPLLFAGYAIFTVPACLGLSVLISNSTENRDWLIALRKYALSGWIFLTAGILLGAWWAYMELGWGGYWGWDPVENATLLPWLTGTAALHIMAISYRTGKLTRASVCLLAVTFILSFFATYLTRSGILQSVHAFGDGGVGMPLLIFVLFTAFVSFFITLSAPPAERALANPVSREGAAILATWLFLAITLIVLLATIWPVVSKLFGGASVGIEPAFYNRVCLPLGAMILVLLAICPWLGWSGGVRKNSLRQIIAVAGAFVASACAIWISGYRLPVALLASAAAIAVLCGLSMMIFRRSLWKNSANFAAFGAHLGLAIAAVGIAFSGPYTLDKELFFAQNSVETVGPYQVKLIQIEDGAGAGYDYLKASLHITLDGKTVGTLEPERRIYAKFGTMQFSEVDVISTLGEDIYASLLGMDEEHRVLVKISLEPLVNWLWIGGFIMCLLPFAGLFGSKPASLNE